MRLTIISTDGAVYKDGVSYDALDLAAVPSEVHAFQWYGEFGEIEFKSHLEGGNFVHPANELVTELPAWAVTAVDKWEEADLARIAAEEAARIAAEEAARIAAEETAAQTQQEQ
jgi:hypothetical protein